MAISVDQAVVPHQLCRWCKVFVAELQENLLSVGGPGKNESFFKHFPNIKTLIDGSHSGLCYLCSILFGNLEERNRSSGVNKVVKETNDLVESGSGNLRTFVREIPEFSQPHWEAFDIFVGTTRSDGPKELQNLHSRTSYASTGRIS